VKVEEIEEAPPPRGGERRFGSSKSPLEEIEETLTPLRRSLLQIPTATPKGSKL
jgi:hypothetical protein